MSTADVIRWDAPGPYEVAFTTRRGGVSEGAFAALNLGLMTGDEPDCVVENRRRACAAIGSDAARATMLRQQHGSTVARADGRGIVTPGTPFERADGLWTEEPGEPIVALTADCLPVALARANGSSPRLAVLHVGWRGLLAGIVASGARALAGGRLGAAVGPGIGPCCYEVGAEVAEPFRAAFGAQVLRGDRLDLWSAAERALRAAGCATVERTDLCTACDPARFFSHRRDDGRTGRQGVVASVRES